MTNRKTSGLNSNAWRAGSVSECITNEIWCGVLARPPSESIIHAQLAHSVKDSLGRAYNRTEFVAQRRTIMQGWADYLDTLRVGAVVTTLVNRRANG